jgi:hypothetical protein
MDCELPTPMVSPHHSAVWDKKLEDWVIEVLSVESLLPTTSDRMIISRPGDGLPHIEIDDI